MGDRSALGRGDSEANTDTVNERVLRSAHLDNISALHRGTKTKESESKFKFEEEEKEAILLGTLEQG